MAKLARKVGTTSQTVYLFIQDVTSATGSGLTGLVFNSAGLTAYYGRTREAAVAISLVTQTVTGAFSSGGFVQYDATNEPGIYRLDIPNAVLASGADSAHVYLQGAANMAPLVLEIDLDAQVDVTHWNGTAVKTPTVAGVVESRLTGTCTQGASDMLIRCGSSTSTPAWYATNIGGASGGPAVHWESDATGQPAWLVKSTGHRAGMLWSTVSTGLELSGTLGFETVGVSSFGMSIRGSDSSGTSAGLYINSEGGHAVRIRNNTANTDGIKFEGVTGTGKDINCAGSQSIAAYLTGVVSPTFVGPGVQAELAASTDSFQCGVSVIDDNGGTTDRWGVRFFKNGQSIATGQATLATLTVTDLTTGVALFTAASLTERAGGVFYYNEATNRIVSGRAYSAVATWTDDAAVRSWPNVVGRDST